MAKKSPWPVNIERAVEFVKKKATGRLGSSDFENLIKFLLVSGNVKLAETIAKSYDDIKSSYKVPAYTFLFEKQKQEITQKFLRKLCVDFAPLLAIEVSEDADSYADACKQLDPKIVAEKKKLKVLLNRAIIELSNKKQMLTYGKETIAGKKGPSSIIFTPVLEFDSTKERQAAIAANIRKRRIKNVLFYALMAVCFVIGIGEGSAPAWFYITKLTALGLANPVIFPIAAFVFLPAASVTISLFHGDSYETFKDLFIKNRFLRDASGKLLPKRRIALNILLVVLAVFAAFTIAGLSYYFSLFLTLASLPAVAIFISVMTFIGYTGVLTFGLMGVFKLESLVQFKSFLHSLLVKPIKDFREELTKKSSGSNIAKVKAITTFLINAVAVVAMFGFSVAVVTATFLMFSGALGGIPIVASLLGPVGIWAFVGVAEIGLGTFFSKNVFKMVNAIRSGIVTAVDKSVDFVAHVANTGFVTYVKNTVNQFVDFVKGRNPATVSSDSDNPYRDSKVTTGKILSAVFFSFAFINASGFALGYLGLASALLGTGVIGLAVGIVFATAYVLASVGGNGFAAMSAVSAEESVIFAPNPHLALTKGFVNEYDLKQDDPDYKNLDTCTFDVADLAARTTAGMAPSPA
ncbi:MAG: hypothetical protein KBD64_05900 [Gammaproteobacteria bacterium]|nr:hypothetical protein [Gammaproteobacteria bacterium]